MSNTTMITVFRYKTKTGRSIKLQDLDDKQLVNIAGKLHGHGKPFTASIYEAQLSLNKVMLTVAKTPTPACMYNMTIATVTLMMAIERARMHEGVVEDYYQDTEDVSNGED